MTPAGVWAAPGRVTVLGDHTDYNAGLALPIALPQRVVCAAAARGDGTVLVSSRQHSGEPVQVPIADLADAAVAGWPRYPLGVVHEFVRRGHAIPGVILTLDGEVPAGAGLSSSAAVECAVAIALRDLFELPVEDDELVDIGRAAENDYVGAVTGTLDQSASILCTPAHALLLDFAAGTHEPVPFDPAAAGLTLLIIDTNTPHRHVDGGYRTRRQECEKAAAALGVPNLGAVQDLRDLERITDPVLRRRARHVVTECARVRRAAELLRGGTDPRALGPLLDEGHASMRDDFEVSTPELDTAVRVATAAGALGARLVGGGFGGSALALVESGAVTGTAAALREQFAAAGLAEPAIFTAVPSAGAQRLV